MKIAYVSPRIEIEEFAPNEYIAACADEITGGTLVVCDGSGAKSGRVGYHGFIADAGDLRTMRMFDEDYKFNIQACGFVDPNTGMKCPQNVDDTQDLDPFGSNKIKKGKPEDYVWIHIEYTGRQHDDEALFRTIGTGIDGGYQNYNAPS